MSRIPREKLSRDQASALFGADVIRNLATSGAVYSIWEKRGVPWEITGPLMMERLSQALDAHSHFSRLGGAADMHTILDVQGRVFRIARQYGITSKEFRSLRELATILAPDEDTTHDATARAAHSGAASPPSGGAASKIRRLKPRRG